MRTTDAYHKWVEWSNEDGVYLGKCPDLITGIHGDDPVNLYAELTEIVAEVISHFDASRRPLPPPTVRPINLCSNRSGSPENAALESLSPSMSWGCRRALRSLRWRERRSRGANDGPAGKSETVPGSLSQGVWQILILIL